MAMNSMPMSSSLSRGIYAPQAPAYAKLNNRNLFECEEDDDSSGENY
jgi:hypothetical protein